MGSHDHDFTNLVITVLEITSNNLFLSLYVGIYNLSHYKLIVYFGVVTLKFSIKKEDNFFKADIH